MAKVEINTAEAQPTNEDAIKELKEQGKNTFYLFVSK